MEQVKAEAERLELKPSELVRKAVESISMVIHGNRIWRQLWNGWTRGKSE